MRKRLFPHSTKCGECGNKNKWKIVNNVWWAEKPYRLEPCCPTCKK